LGTRGDYHFSFRTNCSPLLHERVLKNGAILHTKCIPLELVEDRKNILLKCRQDNQDKEFSADFILVACGRDPNTWFFSPILKKYFDTISNIPETVLPGLYFVGDVIRGPYRQTGVAVGDGIRAAMMVKHYLRDKPVKP
jgi:thioredoxin reductase